MEPPEARETPPGMAGALLRAARESAGMTIDAVAQQLKLAPRQVKAIEDGDYKVLPGKTFTRGFVRNYARLVHLDPERVVSALPGGASAPALEAPTLSPTAPTIGELPTTEHAKSSWARWAIPSVLAAIVAVAGFYEWMRPTGEPRFAGPAAEPEGGAQKDTSARAVPAPAPAPATASTPLPNPIAANAQGSDGAQSAAADSSSVAAPAQSAAGGAAASASGASATAAAAASGTAPPAAGATPASPGVAAVPEQTVVVAFRDNSWAEIRDRNGQVLLTGTYRRGTAQTVTGTPPLTIKIGNAGEVTLRYKGERVDLTPYTQKNVARLTLP
jgi:cytoskeleton protein RodZ